VKFQKRHLPSLYREDVLTDTLKYEQNFQYMIPILKEVELAEEDFFDLKNYCTQKGLEFLCTPFDLSSVDFLMKLGVNAFKIASADLANLELLEYVAGKGKPMLVSTGMSYWEEIEKAVSLLKDKNVPFALLHCRSVYPVWPREVNLRMVGLAAPLAILGTTSASRSLSWPHPWEPALLKNTSPWTGACAVLITKSA